MSEYVNKAMTKRLYYAFLTLFFLITEILIAKYTRGFIRGSVGDILVVVLIFCMIRLIVPEYAEKYLPVYVFIFACFIEFLQLFHYVEVLGMQNNYIVSTALGGTFSFYDLLCYALGAIVCFPIQRLVSSRFR